MAAKGKSRLVIILGVAAAVVVAGLVAIFTVAGSEPETAEVAVQGDPLPVLIGNAPVGQDVAFGWDAPKVTGSDWRGNPVAIDPADGRPKVIVFLAHWCPHCQAEVPQIQEWLNQTGGSSEVDLYAVATSINRSRPNWPPSEWLEREGWTSPTIMDLNNRVSTAYGLSAFPYWVAVNSEGKVVYRVAAAIGVEGLLTFQQLAIQSMAELQDFIGQTGG
ncbi:MAG: TlpA family protein disulfide reductase [Acidimicrobiia bacterium]|nr:TlpA family protein disulfide reductase [Acidimicrobiia bacterium]MYH05529.1 TlpA family protein disulfide reductase [Acidimicrobiia bacterium]MYK56059.1 TlpA family protein disulfide reductase [Acidimicrobiia bacterium]